LRRSAVESGRLSLPEIDVTVVENPNVTLALSSWSWLSWGELTEGTGPL
jgi:hypothetical protein